MISKKEYSTIVKNNSPKSKCFVNGTKAFFIGGFICLIGQVLTDCYSMLDLSKDDAKTLTSVTLIFIGILLTAIGVYDKIAKHGGAGTLVPITGLQMLFHRLQLNSNQRDMLQDLAQSCSSLQDLS